MKFDALSESDNLDMAQPDVRNMGCPGFIDCHVHSMFSVDSLSKPEHLCDSAIKAGLKGISITDHIDLNPLDPGYGFYREKEYFDEIMCIREKYSGSLQVLLGIEFGDPHRYPKEFEEYAKLPYDVIIGSVHYWHKGLCVEELPSCVDYEEALDGYFHEVEASLEFGGFDILGHLGFPKKYYKREITKFDKDAIDNILLLAIHDKITPEINTSSMTQGMLEPSPNFIMIERYIELGGRYVTLGSDAHVPEEVGSNFKTIWDRYGDCLQFGYFENRIFK